MIASIIIPTYNQDPAKLQRAVYSALAQTVPCEVIVVDDGSDDRVRFSGAIRHDTNRGISAAVNTGIKAMSTDWFCWLSSDDTFAPEKVEVQRHFLASKASLASYHAFRVDGAGKCFQPWGTMHQQKRILRAGCAINGSTVMIHKDVFADVGLFDEAYRFGQDWEMWCRIGWKYRWHGLDQILGDRYTGGNLTGRIHGNPDLTAIRDAENERVRATYLV